MLFVSVRTRFNLGHADVPPRPNKDCGRRETRSYSKIYTRGFAFNSQGLENFPANSIRPSRRQTSEIIETAGLRLRLGPVWLRKSSEQPSLDPVINYRSSLLGRDQTRPLVSRPSSHFGTAEVELRLGPSARSQQWFHPEFHVCVILIQKPTVNE